MSIFSLIGLLIFVLCGFLTIFISFYVDKKLYKFWSLFNGAICLWGLCIFLAGISKVEFISLMFWNFSFFFISLMPAIFLRFINVLTERTNNGLVRFCDFYALFSTFLVFGTNLFIKNGSFPYLDVPAYIKSTNLLSIWLLFFISLIGRILWSLLQFIKNEKGAKRIQASYIFWGAAVGFLGGVSVALPSYGLNIFPVGHIFVCVYALAVTFAIKGEYFKDRRMSPVKLLVPFFITILTIVGYCLVNFHLNLFALAGLLLGAACFTLAYVIFSYATQKMHNIWALFNLCIGIWGTGTFLVGISSRNENMALIGWKIAYVGVLLLPVFFYHMISIFCELRKNKFLSFIYWQAIFVLLINILTNTFIGKLEYVFNSFYYHRITWVYLFFFVIWIAIAIKSFYCLFRFIQTSEGLKRTQALYLFWGMLLGFAGGTSIVVPAFGILIYPYGHFFICIYAGICTYAIFRYQVMDISIAITRLGVFLIVYSLVLGLPVWLGFKLLGKGLWFLPVTCMGIFATAGPFIYLFIQKRAEDSLFREQRRYQATLRQASAGMGKIKDLKKLLSMIVYVLTQTVQIEHTLIYVYDEVQKCYVLGASDRRSGTSQFIISINEDSPLVRYLLRHKNLIVFEEIKQRAELNKELELAEIEKIIATFEGALVVPIFIDENLAAIIVMGRRESGKSYTEDDFAAFSNLANQTALAIENAEFYEKMKLTQQQLFQAEKMATIGTMADGLSHQINNRFHALGFIAGDALDTIQMNEGKELTRERMNEILEELKRGFTRVQENVVQGGEIVQGLLRYTRKGEAGFTAIDVDAVLKAALEMVQFKIKTHELKIVREYDLATMPKIKGNFTHLQEVFFNLIDNGYDAMMQRKNEKQEPGYQPTLIVRVLREDGHAEIIFEDNGIGVKDEDSKKLFTPFFTTKLSSKKGTGLGLYVIKKIVEDNHGGQVEMNSKYMQGTQIKLCLPIAIE